MAVMILLTVAGRAVNLAVSKRETVSCRTCERGQLLLAESGGPPRRIRRGWH